MKIGVIMGGISSERTVSLNSGEEVFASFDKKKYDVVKIQIDKMDDLGKAKDLDFAYLVLHGKFGEDGMVQSVLESFGVPYTGSGPMASALCLDKDMNKRILKSADINTAPWLSITSMEEIDYDYVERMGYPIVVKPNSGGSSVATNVVKSKEALADAVGLAFQFDNEVIIEKFIQGEEISCCILEDKVVAVVLIKHNAEFFDYEAKYKDSGTQETVVQFPAELHNQIVDMANKCWKVCKCKVMGRVDMIIKEGVPYVLEINTLPGHTKNSIYPKGLLGAGISYEEMLERIVQASLKVKR
ncbi:MAG TPA: D-alanine--D-alanine ligase [Clostridiaceae bacterium]